MMFMMVFFLLFPFADDKEFMMVKSKSSYYDDANLSGIYSGVRRKTSKREKKRKHISTEVIWMFKFLLPDNIFARMDDA